ncbi:MAG: SAM-dependent chlorinase/fluorinase [Chitinophagales bacterium]
MAWPLVTITSDLGHSDYYAAAFKGALLRSFPELKWMELAMDVTAFDPRHAAYVVRNAYPYFAPGTIHLIYMNPPEARGKMVVASHAGQYFVTFNTGLISLLFAEMPQEAYLVHDQIAASSNLFFVEGCTRVLAHLLEQKPLAEIGVKSPDIRRSILMQPMVQDGMIRGSVQYIDHYGNAITNINRHMLQRAFADRRFVISMNGGDAILSGDYSDVVPGEVVAFLNAEGFIEIAINKGSAFRLLGLRVDSQILVTAL